MNYVNSGCTYCLFLYAHFRRRFVCDLRVILRVLGSAPQKTRCIPSDPRLPWTTPGRNARPARRENRATLVRSSLRYRNESFPPQSLDRGGGAASVPSTVVIIVQHCSLLRADVVLCGCVCFRVCVCICVCVHAVRKPSPKTARQNACRDVRKLIRQRNIPRVVSDTLCRQRNSPDRPRGRFAVLAYKWSTGQCRGLSR